MAVYRDYPISLDAEREDRRLSQIEARYDRGTRRRLDQLGVEAGWRCLEIGPGRGSIAAWLCDRVGPQGSVVAVDMDLRFVSRLQHANLELREADLREVSFEPGSFDLVHTRAVLMHLEAREEILAQLLRCLRPGGIALIEEGDGFPSETLADPILQRSLGVVCGRFSWARALPDRLLANAMTEVDAEIDVDHFPGGSGDAEFWQLTLRRRLELMPPGTLDAGDVAAAHELLHDPSRWTMAMAMISAWGRRAA